MRNRIQIDPWACFLGALLVLTVPISWLFSALCAAVFHELCHVAAIKILGGSILGIRIRIGGAVIESEIPGKREELLCALAGPAGSLLLLALCHVFPKLAICACIQGMFNLLPVYPLDGGRILRCSLELICPEKAEMVQNRMEILICVFIAIFAAAGTFLLSMGLLPLFAAGTMIIKAISRKRPCKRSQIRVQ